MEYMKVGNSLPNLSVDDIRQCEQRTYYGRGAAVGPTSRPSGNKPGYDGALEDIGT